MEYVQLLKETIHYNRAVARLTIYLHAIYTPREAQSP